MALHVLDESDSLFHQRLRLVQEDEIVFVGLAHLVDRLRQNDQSTIGLADLVKQSATLGHERCLFFGVIDRLGVESERVLVVTIAIRHCRSPFRWTLRQIDAHCVRERGRRFASAVRRLVRDLFDHGFQDQMVELWAQERIEGQRVEVERVDGHYLLRLDDAGLAVEIARKPPWVAQEQRHPSPVVSFGPNRVETCRPVERIGRFLRLASQRALAESIVRPRIVASGAAGKIRAVGHPLLGTREGCDQRCADGKQQGLLCVF